jgi:hypothetical protein
MTRRVWRAEKGGVVNAPNDLVLESALMAIMKVKVKAGIRLSG